MVMQFFTLINSMFYLLLGILRTRYLCQLQTGTSSCSNGWSVSQSPFLFGMMIG